MFPDLWSINRPSSPLPHASIFHLLSFPCSREAALLGSLQPWKGKRLQIIDFHYKDFQISPFPLEVKYFSSDRKLEVKRTERMDGSLGGGGEVRGHVCEGDKASSSQFDWQAGGPPPPCSHHPLPLSHSSSPPLWKRSAPLFLSAGKHRVSSLHWKNLTSYQTFLLSFSQKKWDAWNESKLQVTFQQHEGACFMSLKDNRT